MSEEFCHKALYITINAIERLDYREGFTLMQLVRQIKRSTNTVNRNRPAISSQVRDALNHLRKLNVIIKCGEKYRLRILPAREKGRTGNRHSKQTDLTNSRKNKSS